MKTSPPCLSLLGVLALLCGNLFSQAESITVQVRDPSGLPVSGAAVSLALPSGRQIATGHTQAGGSSDLQCLQRFLSPVRNRFRLRSLPERTDAACERDGGADG